MQPTVRGAAMILRPFRADDVDWVVHVSRDPHIQRFVTVPSPYERRDAESFIEWGRAGWAEQRRAEFLVTDGEEHRLARVGMSLTRFGGEIGYWTDPLARGRGITTEAVRMLCRWAFDERGAEQLEWRAEVGNVASRRVAEKVGFLIEATLRGRVRHRGVLGDAGSARYARASLGKGRGPGDKRPAIRTALCQDVPMARAHRDQRPRAHKRRIAEPPLTLSPGTQNACQAQGWYEGWAWSLSRGGAVSDDEYPRVVYCHRPRGHSGAHAKLLRRSRISRRWCVLNW